MALYTDRTYWAVPGRSWHARDEQQWWRSYCGRSCREVTDVQSSDRVPVSGHLCGACSKSIAARTDLEPQRQSRDASDPTDEGPLHAAVHWSPI